MTSPMSLKLPQRESFVLESRSSASLSGMSAPYRDSSNEDDDVPARDYMSERTQRTLVGRAMHALGIDLRPRKHDYDYFSTPREELPDGLLSRKTPPRDVRRRSRRPKVGSVVRRALLALPVFLLMLFGVLHLVQAFLGRSSLFWEVEEYDESFMPNWGQPGHAGSGMAHYPTDATRDVLPIPCHSHNDYWRRIPFLDAIHWGCTGVEADVWLFDEELYVGHNTASLTRSRTFRSLYVEPITDFLDKMNPQTAFSNTTGHGVFDEVPEQTLVLLVDFKTNGRETWKYVYDQLGPLREKGYLSFWDGEEFHSRAVTVVGTGNTPFDLIVENHSHRDIFFDAPLDQMWEPAENPNAEPTAAPSPLGRHSASGALFSRTQSSSKQGKEGTHIVQSADEYDTSNSYYASVSFTSTIGFVWRGKLSPRQMELIRGQIRGAKKRGLKARYWDTPSWPRGLRNHIWHVLMKEGADVLNVDDLKSAAVENWKARIHKFWGR